MLIKKGDRGRQVKEVQTLLNHHGFWKGTKFTEYFGDITEAAVKRFQEDRSLVVDGIVDYNTMSELQEGVETSGVVKKEKDTDNKLNMLGVYKSDWGFDITRAYLDDDEYVQEYGKIRPFWFFLHHTAGSSDPIATVDNWNKDSRGRVATQYCIGGIDLKGGTKHDGLIVECFPDYYLGWHLGKVDNFDMSRYSVAVEINNWGYLEKKGDKFFNYAGGEVPKDQVCDLGYKFRGKQYWHRYTDAQIESLGNLIKHIKRIYPSIPISEGLPQMLRDGMKPVDAFAFMSDACKGKVKGTLTHSNVRSDKMDCYPDPRLVELLKTI